MTDEKSSLSDKSMAKYLEMNYADKQYTDKKIANLENEIRLLNMQLKQLLPVFEIVNTMPDAGFSMNSLSSDFEAPIFEIVEYIRPQV